MYLRVGVEKNTTHGHRALVTLEIKTPAGAENQLINSLVTRMLPNPALPPALNPGAACAPTLPHADKRAAGHHPSHKNTAPFHWIVDICR